MSRLTQAILLVAACWFAASAARGAELKVPAQVTAGAGLSIPTSGSGDATFYLAGPGRAVKRTVKLGQEIKVAPEEVQDAGRYVAIVRDGGDVSSAAFWVVPAQPARVSFLARPSRLPVALNGGISGVVYAYDKFHNLITQPLPVTFKLAVGDTSPITRTVNTRYGVASVALDSSRKEGPAQFVASIGDVSERRVVQQVASDPCNLRMKAERTAKAIEVSTDPIRDCSGNPVPDGTIVTFTAVSPKGKSSVDARIKKGVAKAELPPLQNATISVASGVVMGNEIHVGGGQ